MRIPAPPSLQVSNTSLFETAQPLHAGIQTAQRLHAVRFAGTEENIRTRLEYLRKGLLELAHDPAVEHLNMDALLQRAEHYLTRREQDGTNPPHPLFIAFGGPSAGGKTTLSSHMADVMANLWHQLDAPLPEQIVPVSPVVRMDGFYPDRSALKKQLGVSDFLATVDLDTPGAWNMGAFQNAVENILKRRPVFIHDYDYVTSRPVPTDEPLPNAMVYVFDGNHMLNNQDFNGSGTPLHQLFDVKLYVHTDPHLVDNRWRERTQSVRDIGVTPEALESFYRNVVAARRDFVEPTRSNAHLVINTRHSKEAVMETTRKFSQLLVKALFARLHAMDAVA